MICDTKDVAFGMRKTSLSLWHWFDPQRSALWYFPQCLSIGDNNTWWSDAVRQNLNSQGIHSFPCAVLCCICVCFILNIWRLDEHVWFEITLISVHWRKQTMTLTEHSTYMTAHTFVCLLDNSMDIPDICHFPDSHVSHLCSLYSPKMSVTAVIWAIG